MTDPVIELAAGVRNVVVRLAYSLRSAATRDGVTPTRLTALGILERRGPMRPGDLAARLNITAASMSRLTEALEQGGWVERSSDPGDRRACLLNLSGHAQSALDTLRQENAEELAALIRELPEGDRQVLDRALPVLARLTERMFDENTDQSGSAVVG